MPDLRMEDEPWTGGGGKTTGVVTVSDIDFKEGGNMATNTDRLLVSAENHTLQNMNCFKDTACLNAVPVDELHAEIGFYDVHSHGNAVSVGEHMRQAACWFWIWIPSFMRRHLSTPQYTHLLSVFPICFYATLLLTSICHTTDAQSTDPDCGSNTDCYPPALDLLNEQFTARTLTVSSTCGQSGDEIYRRLSTELDDTEFICNSTFPGPKENMIDFHTDSIAIFNLTLENPQLSTYWQTRNTINTNGADPREEFIVFDLRDQFLVRIVQIIFLSPHTNLINSDMRPQAMVLEGRESANSDWQPWRYYARDCNTFFPGVPIQEDRGVQYNATTAVCMQVYYAGDTTTFMGREPGVQLVTFNPAQDYDSEYGSVYEVQRHYVASAIRVRLVHPADDVPLSSYYAVADLEISGQCACFGHAATCTGDNAAVCDCQHNTRGVNCEQCLPLYNNRPWSMGFDGQANACEDCGCNGHAQSCQYDVTKGYGVCDDCMFPTTGDKCEWCAQSYYINPTVTQNVTLDDPSAECAGFNGTDVITYTCGDYCIPCNCSTDGIIREVYTCENATGQCECKQHVTGRACDQCEETFWNLAFDNEFGCTECDCHLAGTLNNTNMCDKVTGQCMCKENTNGTRCDACKTDTFLLEEANADGCTSCACDPGGSLTSSCHNVTGECSCRDNIIGRTCSTAAEGYFVPRLDYLTVEAEFTPEATIDNVVEEAGEGEETTNVTGRGFLRLSASESVQFTYTVPRTFNYDVVLRYRTESDWTNLPVITLGDSEGLANVTYECGGQSRDLTAQLNLLATLPADEKGGVVVGQMCLRADTVYRTTVEVNVPGTQGAVLLLDSIVFLPVYTDLPATSRFDAESLAAMATCYDATRAVDHVTRSNLTCYQYEFSLMADFLNGSLGCNCDDIGSANIVCGPEGGQCECKPHIILQDCSQCEVDHYDFYSGTGCIPCNCHVTGSVRTACNESGICECLPNVIGDRCGACSPEHYGLSTGQGCTVCTCSPDYSLNNSCLDDGQCHCKPGVGGINCDRCAEGFHTLTADGCTVCDCDEDGSSEGICNATTGQCTCKDNVQGENCDQCKPGFYGLGPWDSEGCLQCQCSGHSQNCSSASNWTQVIYTDTWDLLSESAIQDKWGGISSTGEEVEVDTRLDLEGRDPQYVLEIANSATNQQYEQYYFTATDVYLGNKRGAYAQYFIVDLSYRVELGENDTLDILNVDSGDVIIQGEYVDFTLVAALPELPTATEARYEFLLKEENWRKDSLSGSAASYEEFMRVLSSIQSLWVRAKFSNFSGAVTSMYFARMGYAQEGNATTDDAEVVGPINNVEQCVCPSEYAGQFCEQCAEGYTRATPGSGAYSTCVPCMCNNHATPGRACDPETGECMCTHNTTGTQCQLCLPGFYGDATVGAQDDCRPCLCPGDVIAGDVNVFASTCELISNGVHRCVNCSEGHGGSHCEFCLQDYYGTPEDPGNADGACTPCECNGRADTCNSTTGYCTACRENTAGMECEICGPGYFGNAMIETCMDCNCTSVVGSTGDCNDRTGDCDCLQNVIGARCDQCDVNTYNYSSGEGCSECGCHSLGALSSTCDVISGECQCKTHVIGRACDTCQDTYWNINANGCDPCECTPEGTANNTGETAGTCDLDTGQCTCALPGIIGRTCDHCAAGTPGVNYTYVTDVYIGEYPTCELCGECYDNWAAKIDALGAELLSLRHQVLLIWRNYDMSIATEVHAELELIDSNLQSVQSSITIATELLRQLDYLSQSFQDVEDEVGNYTVRLGAIRATLEQTTSDIRALQEHDGSLEVGGQITTAEAIENETLALMAQHENLTRQGIAAWENIQGMTLLINQANGDVQILRNRVAAAMGVLDVAMETRETTDSLINGTFSVEYRANTDRLAGIQSTADDFLAMQSHIENSVTEAQRALDGANETAQTTSEQAVAKMEQTSADVARAEMLRFNATQTESLVQNANSVALQYKDLAREVKDNMTRAFETVVTYAEVADQAHRDMDQVYYLDAEINTVTLRPLQDIQAIAAQINDTQFSEAAVRETNDKADAALVRAEEASNVTQAAAEASQVTLDEVTQIQNNLNVAEQQRAATVATIDAIDNLSEDIQGQIDDVRNKSSLARRQGDNAVLSLNNLVVFRESVEQCFDDVTARSDDADAQIMSQANDLVIASEIRTANAQLLDNANSIIDQKSQGVDEAYSGIVALDNDVTSLQQDLAEVEAITSLEELQNDYTTLVNEMTVMESELLELETLIDQLLNSLQSLNPDTASCTHS